MMNPQIEPDIPASFVLSGGYVMCNDYHATALKMKQNKNFKVVGMISKDENGKCSLITEELDDYLSLIEEVDLKDSVKVFQTGRKKESHIGYFVFEKIS